MKAMFGRGKCLLCQRHLGTGIEVRLMATNLQLILTLALEPSQSRKPHSVRFLILISYNGLSLHHHRKHN
jgi:hypothetical protein